MDVILLLVALVVILIGAELFTNGIEWVGHKLALAEGAVGSVLAAVGTALPETMIPFVAILFSASAGGESTAAAHAVGVGAILGAPFMLATLAMFVTGLAVLSQARRRPQRDRMPIDTVVVGKDIRYFLMTYGIAVAAALLPGNAPWTGPVKVGVAVLLVVLYAWYVRSHFVGERGVHSTEEVELAPLRLGRIDARAYQVDPQTPRLRIVVGQVVFALGLIIAGAVVFVGAVEHLATQLGVAPAILSLVTAPIATELPEKFNSVLWVRQGKDTLAMGNITGAMVFQSCIPVVVALLFAADSWVVSRDSLIAFASAGMAFVATIAIFLPMMRRSVLTGRWLLIGGVFYALYLALVGASVTGMLSGILGPDAH